MTIPAHLIERIENEADLLESFHRSKDVHHPASYYSGFEAGASFGYQLAMGEQKKLLDELEQALEFYADGESWSTIDHNKSPTTYDRLEYDKDLGVGDFDINEQTNDRNVSGLRARLALEKLKAHRGTDELP